MRYQNTKFNTFWITSRGKRILEEIISHLRKKGLEWGSIWTYLVVFGVFYIDLRVFGLV